MSRTQDSFASLASFQATEARRTKDSFASLESHEDQLVNSTRVENDEMEACVHAVKQVVRQLEACEETDNARTAAYKLLQQTDQQLMPYLIVELWLSMRELAQGLEKIQPKLGTGTPSSLATTRAADRKVTNERYSHSKLGTVPLPVANDLQLPQFEPDESSNSSEQSDSQPPGGTDDKTWKAVLGDSATTHQDFFDQLASDQTTRFQAASETEDEDTAELDVTAMSYPLLTIHGNEQEKETHPNDPKVHKPAVSNDQRSSNKPHPSREQPVATFCSEDDSQFIDLGTLPCSSISPARVPQDEDEFDVHAARQRMGSLMEKFSEFALSDDIHKLEQGPDAIIIPKPAVDPASHTNRTIPTVLTSNDDLNEELKASLARLSRLYGDETPGGTDLKFPEFSQLDAVVDSESMSWSKHTRLVDGHERSLEDDDNDVYHHYFGAGADAMQKLNHQHSRRSFTVPTNTTNEVQRRRRDSHGNKLKTKPPISESNIPSTPRRAVRSYARRDSKNKTTSPLAQGARRVAASAKRLPSSASSTSRPSSTSRAATSSNSTKQRPASATTRRANSKTGERGKSRKYA